MLERVEIEAFLTLAEVLHFGRTAEKLHLSPGRISQTIKALENRIGASLFERTSRTVQLTATGSLLYDALRPAVDQVEHAVALATTAARGTRTRLHVGYSTPWCGDLVIAAGDALLEELAGADVSFEEIQLSDPLARLRSGTVDIQLSEFPVNEADIVTGPVVVVEPRALIVPAQHPFAKRTSVTLEDLAETRLVPIRGAAPAYWHSYHYPERTPSGTRIPHTRPVTYWHEVLGLVAANRGVTPAAARAQHYHPHPGIAYIPFADADPIRYGLLWRADRSGPTIARFAELVATIAARQGPPDEERIDDREP
ncbi:LysR family transcriptional regulator [Prescottella agglutinans]|uniref:DNA-binding transcriptional LysR family regulator n=1 Tax=Prescottella agglutinans TaxID=1644129 RepID=A0ABT6M5Z5_9NOCA|nr:LysR family transcriptional regulator [Prescottella agglutinans]MDH6279720.1 DNA-binding transcriptional LysR family regulator [Prescottella agglutinans]